MSFTAARTVVGRTAYHNTAEREISRSHRKVDSFSVNSLCSRCSSQMPQTNVSQTMTPCGRLVGFVREMNVVASCVNTDAAVVVVSTSKLQSAVSCLSAATQLLIVSSGNWSRPCKTYRL